MQLDPKGLSPLPWTYHNLPTFGRMGKDWIEDANGNIVVENVGRIDGPAIVEAMNRRAPSPSPAPGVVEALRKARQLVDIATDWNLDEVEIDGEMVRTYSLGAEFDTALASSQPAKEREGGE